MRTKFMNLLVFSVLLLTFSAAEAKPQRFGLGFILGSPTALSGKLYLSTERAVDLQVAFNDDYLLVYGDYLYHFGGVFGRGQSFTDRLVAYVGFGPIVAISSNDNHDKGRYFKNRDDDFAVGVRVPFGAEWVWDKIPLGVGLEFAPGIVVAPSTRGLLHGGLTLRYYF